MTNRDYALEIFDRVILLQSQIEALKKWVLMRPNAPNPEHLDRQLFDLESQIRINRRHDEQSREFGEAIQCQTDAANMLQTLHDHILCRS